jgi:predicted transcriptional regulator
VTDTATETAILNASVPKAYLARLELLAQKTGRSQSSLVSEALVEYLEYTEKYVHGVLEALAEEEAGIEPVDHARVAEWIDSLGTDHELPRPR